MKLESLVIANQPCRGEYVLEPCTRVAVRLCKLVGVNPTGIRYSVPKRNLSSESARIGVKGESSSSQLEYQ